MNFLNKKIILALLLISIIPLVIAIEYPILKDFVTDNANIIDAQSESEILQLAKQIEQQTTVEIAVVTIPSLDGIDIESYAVELFEKAGIGKKDLDNGLLILVALNERKFRIEVGYGLEGTLPDTRAMEIGNNILTPHFKKMEYGKGIYNALAVIYGYLVDNEEVISQYKSNYINTRKSAGISTI